MPIKNKHDFVFRTLNSIFQQKNEFSEIIVISDKANKIHLKNITNKLEKNLNPSKYQIVLNNTIFDGPGVARDIGIKKARSEYIAFIDDDDLWPNNYLKIRKNFILRNNSEFSASPYSYVDENYKDLRLINFPKKNIRKNDLLWRNPIGNSTVIVSRSLILKAGGYSTLKKRNDYATWMRILKLHKCHYCKNIKNVKILRRKSSLTSKKYSLIIYQYLAYRESGKNRIVSILLTIYSVINGMKNVITKYITFK